MKQIKKTAQHLKIGSMGEQIAAKWLSDRGFSIIDRHYLKKWGEIDIVAEKDAVVHFVEVKAVSYETREKLEYYVSCGTFRPEEHVYREKLQRLYRAIATWIAEKKYGGEYQLDVVTVSMVKDEEYAVVDIIEKVFLE